MLDRIYLVLLLITGIFLTHAQPKKYIVTDSMQDASSLYMQRFQPQPLKSQAISPAAGPDSIYVSAYPDKALSKEFYMERLSLFISDTVESKAYWNRMNALFPIYIINASTQSRDVLSEEGSIILIQEAMDEKGQWRPIEFWHVKDPYIKIRHQKEIPSKHYMELGVPRYQGAFSTTLRVKVLYTKTGRCLISNQYQGSIMKEQFWAPQPGQRNLYYLDKPLF